MKAIILAATLGFLAVGSASAQQVASTTTSGAQALAIAGGGGSGGVTEFGGRYTINNTPSLGSMAVALANACAMVHGGQGVIAGFGIGGQVTTESDECTRRATAAAYWAMGDQTMAREIMSDSRFAREARERLNARAAQQAQANVPVATPVAVRAAAPVAQGCPAGTVPLPAPHQNVCR